VGLNHLTVPFCIVCLLVGNSSDNADRTAAIRAQPGLWNDTKRMRPRRHAQLPQQPKSDCDPENSKNAGAAWLAPTLQADV
jgi:hypothetical protein